MQLFVTPRRTALNSSCPAWTFEILDILIWNNCSCWCWLILPCVFAVVGMPKQATTMFRWEQLGSPADQLVPVSGNCPNIAIYMQWLPRSFSAKALQGLHASRATMTSCVMVDGRATPISDPQRSQQRAHGRFCHVASSLRFYLQWLSSTYLHNNVTMWNTRWCCASTWHSCQAKCRLAFRCPQHLVARQRCKRQHVKCHGHGLEPIKTHAL